MLGLMWSNFTLLICWRIFTHSENIDIILLRNFHAKVRFFPKEDNLEKKNINDPIIGDDDRL